MFDLDYSYNPNASDPVVAPGGEALRQAIADRKKSRLENVTVIKARKPNASLFESLGDTVERAKDIRIQHAADLVSAKRYPPKNIAPVKWLAQPGKLDWATKRRMVKKIADVANPTSKNTRDVFTLDGKRYALTDLYRAPLTEKVTDKISEVKTRAAVRSSAWWTAHKNQVVLAAVAGVAGFLLFNSWKTAQLQRQLGASRGPARLPARPAVHTGYYAGAPSCLPYATSQQGLPDYADTATGWGMPFTDTYGTPLGPFPTFSSDDPYMWWR